MKKFFFAQEIADKGTINCTLSLQLATSKWSRYQLRWTIQARCCNSDNTCTMNLEFSKRSSWIQQEIWIVQVSKISCWTGWSSLWKNWRVRAYGLDVVESSSDESALWVNKRRNSKARTSPWISSTRGEYVRFCSARPKFARIRQCFRVVPPAQATLLTQPCPYFAGPTRDWRKN